MGTPASRTGAAIAARRERTTQMLARVDTAIGQVRRETGKLSVRAIAHRAGVSATFLYENAHARALLATARATTTSRRRHAADAEADHVEATWRERALNAEYALGQTQNEVLAQRRHIGELAGQLRDLRTPQAGESTHRLSSENAALQQQLRQLTAEHRVLQQRLEAARSTNRFLDRRVADLEAQLAEQYHRDQTTSSAGQPER